MANKRMFIALDEMNQNDTKNKTETLQISNSFVSACKARGGGHIIMGVTENIILDLLFNEDKIPLLLTVDKKEFERISKS